MTEQSKRDEILDTLKSILTFIRWIGIPAVTGIGFLIASLIADHYDQTQLDKDRDYMKPKVVRLWSKAYPNLTSDELKDSQ